MYKISICEGAQKMQVGITDFRVVDFKNVKAFFTLELQDLGMKIKDCKYVLNKEGAYFIGWPSVKDASGEYKNFIFLSKDSKNAEALQEEILNKIDKKL